MAFTTNHGAVNLRKRLGVPKEDTQKAATEAVQRGIPREAMTGKLRRYVDSKYFGHDRSARLFIWRNQIHVVAKDKDVHITCYPLPGKLLPSAINQLERWAEQSEQNKTTQP